MEKSTTAKKLISFAIAFVLVLTLFTFVPVSVGAKSDAYSTISAGLNHTMAIKSDGSLWAWGWNNDGQLGDGTTNYRRTPIKIMDDVVQVSAGGNLVYGYSHTMAIKKDGSLWAWGGNYDGILGDGTITTYDDYRTVIENNNKSFPVKIMDDVIQVSAGDTHTMAIKSDGSLWAWGLNISGQLGDGTLENKILPIKIMEDVVQVSAGNGYTIAIKNDGSLWAWGWRSFGNIPTKIMDDVIQVSVGRAHSMAIQGDGSLWAWGWNLFGMLGDSTAGGDYKYPPIKVMDGVAQVSAGYEHTMAIKNDGSLWAWGRNDSGQLGDGTKEHKIIPVKIMDEVIQVSAGDTRTFAIKNDGTLWGWGGNRNGGVGDGTTEDRLIPVKIMDDVMLPTQAPLEPTDPTAETSLVGSVIRLPILQGNKGFNIYRSEESGETGELIVENIGGKTFVDVNVEAGKTYHYTVETILPDGSTVMSATVSVTVQDDFIGGEIKGEKSFILMTINDPLMSVDGVLREIDPGRGTVPLIKDSRTLVPIRSIIEAMGGTVEWDGGEGKVSLDAYGHSVVMWLNNREIIVDGETKSMDVAPQSINDRTMLPVRFVAENIGCQIAWIGSTQEVIIVFAK